MDQNIINIIIAVAGTLGGWWMKAIWESIRDLKEEDKKISEKVNSVEVMIAGDCVKRSELGAIVNLIFAKLDKIHDMLAEKADKP